MLIFFGLPTLPLGNLSKAIIWFNRKKKKCSLWKNPIEVLIDAQRKDKTKTETPGIT